MTTQDAHTTDVVFRKFKQGGDIIALFPGLPGGNSPHTCLSYMSVGQHGAASTDLHKVTVPATAEESAALARELERIGYRLRVIPRASCRHYHQRVAACP